MQPLEDDLYTIPEVAKALRVSVSTVWRWIDAGRLPALRVGQRRIRIRKQDLTIVMQPFTDQSRKEAKIRKSPKQSIPLYKMSSNEAKDQLALIEHVRSLKEQILARRGGKLLPPSWKDINEAREERSNQL